MHDAASQQSRGLGRAADLDGARDHSRHRQRHLHLRAGFADSRASGQARATARAGSGADLPHCAAVDPGLADWTDPAGIHGVGQRILLARHHPDRRRRIPDREGDPRDSWRGRSPRGRGRCDAGERVFLGDRADHHHRPGVLDRLHHHRHRHGAGPGDHDRRRRDFLHRDVRVIGTGLVLRGQAPDHQDAGAGLPGADRCGAGGRRFRIPYSAGLHLFRHRLRACLLYTSRCV